MEWGLHVLHLAAAFVWVGGMVFLLLVAMPVSRAAFPQADHLAFVHRVGLRFRTVGWWAIGLLVGTGVWKAVRLLGSWEALTETPYGRRLMWKLTWVAFALLVAGLHDFWIGPRTSRLSAAGDAAAERFRVLSRVTGLLLLLAVAVIVGLAAALRVSQLA